MSTIALRLSCPAAVFQAIYDVDYETAELCSTILTTVSRRMTEPLMDGVLASPDAITAWARGHATVYAPGDLTQSEAMARLESMGSAVASFSDAWHAAVARQDAAAAVEHALRSIIIECEADSLCKILELPD